MWLQASAEGPSVRRQAFVHARRLALDLRRAVVSANREERHLLAGQRWIVVAPGHTRIGHAQRDIAAAYVIPVSIAAHARGVHRGPDAADAILHPEVQIGMIAEALIPDRRIETPGVISGHHDDLVAKAKVRPQPVPDADEGAYQGQVIEQRLPHDGN